MNASLGRFAPSTSWWLGMGLTTWKSPRRLRSMLTRGVFASSWAMYFATCALTVFLGSLALPVQISFAYHISFTHVVPHFRHGWFLAHWPPYHLPRKRLAPGLLRMRMLAKWLLSLLLLGIQRLCRNGRNQLGWIRLTLPHLLAQRRGWNHTFCFLLFNLVSNWRWLWVRFSSKT